MAKVAVVDDEEGIVWAFRRHLESKGHEVVSAGSVEQAVEVAAREKPAIVFMDVRLPGADGLTGVERVRAVSPASRFVVMTGHGTIDTVMRAEHLGVVDYLPKPIDLAKADAAIERVLHGSPKAVEVEAAKRELREAAGFGLIGRAPGMQEVFRRAAAAATSESAVLILGESGTGKELLARAIHANGPRAAGPFEPVNCASIPETLLESELYGHERGAFTGAVREKRGKFEAADGGTAFLDEASELSPAAQAKLLRFLDERTFERVGSTERRAADVRILAATNRDLEDLVARGRFREDLYFRLRVVTIDVPPLRERMEDLPLLAAHFLKAAGAEAVTPEALELLRRHAWPGNVRELRHAIEQGAVLARGGVVGIEHLPTQIGKSAPAPTGTLASMVAQMVESHYGGEPGGQIPRFVEAVERALIERALREADGNQSEAARRLGITRLTLRSKAKRYGIKA